MDFYYDSQDVVELEPEMKKIKSSPSEDVHDGMPEPVTSPTELGYDELSFIFSNLCLCTKDLLNFRLMNETWRDAATSALLQRDGCYVALDNKKTPAVEDKDEDDDDDTPIINGIRSFFCRHGDKKKILFLAELTDLLSKSLKFPASNFHIHIDPDRSSIVYYDHPDLLRFFKLHGDKIKTLCPHGFLALQPLLDILSTYTPNIKCLDLTGATDFGSKIIKAKKENIPKSTSFIPVKYLRVNQYCNSQTMQLLLSFLPKLCSIENVNIVDRNEMMAIGCVMSAKQRLRE